MEMLQLIAKNKTPLDPNSSILSKIEVIGVFITPQKMETRPRAAPKPGFKPNMVATKLPKVAPMKKVGTISPPLKPAASVMEVKIIFNRKASGFALPPKASSMTSIPAPLYAVVWTSKVSKIIRIPPVIILTYSFGIKNFIKLPDLCSARQKKTLMPAHRIASMDILSKTIPDSGGISIKE